MIDITVDNNEVRVENQLYHSFNDKDALVVLIADVIDKAKYSGESITLWRVKGENKHLIKEW